MISNTSWLFNKFWGISAKELCKKVQGYSNLELKVLYNSTLNNSGGPQRIQFRFIVKEMNKRQLV